jgi:hypothetical protein
MVQISNKKSWLENAKKMFSVSYSYIHVLPTNKWEGEKYK